MPSSSIRWPLAATLLVGVMGITFAAAEIIGQVYERDAEHAAAASLRSAQGTFRALQDADVRKMDAALSVLLEDEALRRAFLGGDRLALLAAALPRFRELERDGITHWYFIGPDRRVFLRVHKPDLSGDLVNRTTLAEAARTRRTASGLELGQTAFALRVVRPLVVDGKVMGYVELAEAIEHFLSRMKADTGSEYGVLIEKRFLDAAEWKKVTGPARNTWDARPDVVVIDTTTFTEGIVDFQGAIADLPENGLVMEEELRDGGAWIRAVYPIADAAGRRVGAMAVLHDFTRMHEVLAGGKRQVLLVVLGMSVLACLVIWAVLETIVLGPIRREVAAAEAALHREPEDGNELVRLRAVVGRLRAPGARDAGGG